MKVSVYLRNNEDSLIIIYLAAGFKTLIMCMTYVVRLLIYCFGFG